MAKTTLRSFRQGGFEYQLRNVFCGKKTCTRCPHGPYWYMIIHRRDGKKPTKYIGKELPEGVTESETHSGMPQENN